MGPFENLRSASKIRLQDGSASCIEKLYDSLIKPQFKHEDAIRIIHNSILSYVDGLTPTFFLRLYGSFKRDSYHKQRRGFLSQYPSGIKISYCDNTFTLIFAGMKLSGIPYSSDDLKNLLQNRKLVVGFAQVSAEKEFKAALADKVGTELDTKRKDLAGTIMTKEPEENTDGDNTQSTEIDD